MITKAQIQLSLSGKAITEPLDKIANRGFGFSRVFDDFLGLACHALSAQEEDYMNIIRRYPNQHPMGQREADYFKEAFHAWQEALKLDYRDYLGEVYEQRVSLGEHGQFFTSESLCELMRQMTGGTIDDDARVSDPACGSGRNLLAATRSNRLAYFHGIDLDLRCVRMTALNLLCRNVNGAVVWGNSLTLKAHGGYELTRTLSGGAMEWVGENRASELIRMGLTEQPQQETAQKEQCEEQQFSLGL
jgi:type I restriction-modification system DNA methylase subunit